MQWLIDIIKEWVEAKGYLTTGFVRRVSQAAWDWTLGTVIEDEQWRELDCSAIVPAGAKAILFNVQIRNSAINKRFFLRYPNDANSPGRPGFNTQVANTYFMGNLAIACDTDRKVEYWFTEFDWTGVQISILGWWL